MIEEKKIESNSTEVEQVENKEVKIEEKENYQEMSPIKLVLRRFFR